MSSYGKLTKRDLRGLDRDLCRVVLEMIECGAVGRLTKKGHVMLRCGELSTTIAGSTGDHKTLTIVRGMLRKMREEQAGGCADRR